MPVAKVVVHPAHVAEGAGLAHGEHLLLVYKSGAPAVQARLVVEHELVEEIEGLLLLAEIGIDSSHRILGHHFAGTEACALIERQRLIAVVQRFFEVSGIAVEVGEGVQLRGLVALVLRGARFSELLLMQGDEALKPSALRAGRAA